jgi:aldehyde dehydrogenase (NAD+)
LFGKYFNCGQTCIGVDHVYVHSQIKDSFKEVLLKTAANFYGNQQLADEGNYGKIIN